jgi:hypothetical protein
MLAKIYSAAVYGVDAYEVEIEVNGAGGKPLHRNFRYVLPSHGIL